MAGTRLLLVEDQLQTRMVASAVMAQWGFDVTTAENGLDALAKIEARPPQIVIADWEMPGLNGPGLCERIRASASDQYIYMILFTTRDDTDSLVQGIEVGADDFVHKPATLDGYRELLARIRAGERIIQLQQVLQEKTEVEIGLRHEIELTHRQQNDELESAGQMQRRLIPAHRTESNGQALCSRYLPSAQLSGDMLGYFDIDAVKTGFFAIDVAGHGIATSILSSSLSLLMTAELSRTAQQGMADLASLAAQLNSQHQVDEVHHQYFTLILGTINRASRRVDICVAGHPLPVLVQPDGTTRDLGKPGFPIGLLDSADYQALQHTYTPGERLFIFSDGITECRNLAGDDFGQTRLRQHLSEYAKTSLDDTLQALETRLRDWTEQQPFFDDLSIMAIQFGE